MSVEPPVATPVSSRSERRSRRRRTGPSLLLPLVVLALVAFGCAEDEGGSDGSGDSDSTESTDGDGSGREDAMSLEDATDWLLEFTGGTAGDAEGEPYRIGFAHSNDAFPEGLQAADAAVEFINA